MQATVRWLTFLTLLGVCSGASLHLDLDLGDIQGILRSSHAWIGEDGTCTPADHEGVICTGMDDGENVTVTLSLDEICKSGKLKIVARFSIGNDVSFDREFRLCPKGDTNKTFCRMVKEKEYCFRVNVEEHRCPPDCDKLVGSLAITTPRPLNFGHFELIVRKERSLQTEDDGQTACIENITQTDLDLF